MTKLQNKIYYKKHYVKNNHIKQGLELMEVAICVLEPLFKWIRVFIVWHFLAK